MFNSGLKIPSLEDLAFRLENFVYESDLENEFWQQNHISKHPSSKGFLCCIDFLDCIFSH